MKQEGTVHQTTLKGVTWLRHTLLPRTFYSSRTLCIVSFTVFFKLACYNLPLSTLCQLDFFFSLEHSAPNPLFPRTLSSSAQFSSQHPLLLKTPCSSAHFAAQHTFLLSTLYYLAHFAPWNTLLPRMLSNKGL